MLSALVLTGAGCVRNTPATTPAQNNVPVQSSPADNLPASQPAAQSTAPQAASVQITVANFAFDPNSITVKAGTVVKWTNDDQVVHNIKSDNGSFPNSANLNTGDYYEFKFDKPGVYNYSCGIHPSMRGQVVVQ